MYLRKVQKCMEENSNLTTVKFHVVYMFTCVYFKLFYITKCSYK